MNDVGKGLAVPGGEVEKKPLTLVVFEMAGRRCAIPSGNVLEVVLLPELYQPPGLPAITEGVMNLAGTAVPVVRADRLFRYPERETDLYTPLLVLRGIGYPLALMVDRVIEVRTVPTAALIPVRGDETFKGCVHAEVKNGDETIHLLSLERLLVERERTILADFQAREQDRVAGSGNDAGDAAGPDRERLPE